MANKQNIIPDDLMEHALYHVLIGRIERHFEIDPCPAIKASSDLTFGLMADVRAYLKWSGEADDWHKVAQVALVEAAAALEVLASARPAALSSTMLSQIDKAVGLIRDALGVGHVAATEGGQE